MPSGHHPYIDICALEAVRARFAAGDAMAVLTPALDEVIWANGPGAALFGFSDIGAIIGAAPQIGLAARRQIMATSGYPTIGKHRAITVRLASGMTSRAVSFVASEIALPGGEDAILLTAPAPAASWRSPVDTAGRAIAGLDQAGQHAAIVDADGRLVAASSGFDALGIKAETLGDLVAEARAERLLKRMIEAGPAPMPAGFLRLTDNPATHLLVVIDEVLPDADEAVAATGGAPAGTDATGAVAATSPAMPEHETAEPVSAPTASVEEPAEPAERALATSEPAEERDTNAPAGPEHGAGEPTMEPGAVAVADLDPVERPTSAEGQDNQQVAPDDRPTEHQAPPAEVTAEAEPAAVAGAEATLADEASRDEDQAPAAEVDGTPETAGEVEAAAGEAPPSDAAAPRPAGASLPPIAVDRSAAPVRFVWKTDAAGRFSEIGGDFVAAVGRPAADVLGLSFREAAGKLGIDPSGEIAGLLERHDTWSGRAVLWPVAGTDLRIPVDLAALPTYDRDRSFAGFKGFGVARAADAVVDPKATGFALIKGDAAAPAVSDKSAEENAPAAEQDAKASATGEPTSPTDPFQGEPPILTIVPKQDRRSSDKVIRLAEHRQPTIEKGLSAGERNAFREIGDRLKKDSGVPVTVAPAEPVLRADNDRASTSDRAPATPAAEGDGGRDSDSEEPRPESEPENGQGYAEAGEARPDDGDAQSDAVVAASEASEEQQGGAPVEESPAEDGSEHSGQADPTDLAATDASPPADAQGEPTLRSEAPIDVPDARLAESQPSDTPAPVELASEPAAAIDDTAPTLTDDTEQLAVDTNSAGDQIALQPDYLPSAFALGSPSGARVPIDTSILEKLPVPVLIHSGDELHYANREFLDLTGYDAVEELYAAGGLGVLFGEPYPAEEGEAEPGRKLRLRTSEGLEYPVEAFLQSVPWGERKALLLSLRRSWRQPVSYPAAPAAPTPVAESEIEARISEMRAIVDTATDGVVLITPEGAIRSISRPAEALFGFDSADVAGKAFSSLFAIESQRAARDYLNGLSENGVASVLNDGREVIGREAQGRFIPLFMTIGKLPNDSGYCAVVRDITQWKRAEEELTQARAQAERASSQKTDFLARVSHEIRTPLNAIIGFSELMLDEKFGPVGNDRYRDYLRDINRSGNHVLDLVNDLLDISKIEAGQQEMSYEAVSLNDTLGETVAMMQPAANRERVIIRSSFAARLPEVVADLRSVRQIALNLLSNAVRYTPAGGQVIVSTAYEASGDVVMRVRDTGIGMSQAEIEQALKPFKQINALKRARGDGTGLGLPLTKAMVEANRARFMINSTPGEGTLVEVSFPSTRVLAD